MTLAKRWVDTDQRPRRPAVEVIGDHRPSLRLSAAGLEGVKRRLEERKTAKPRSGAEQQRHLAPSTGRGCRPRAEPLRSATAETLEAGRQPSSDRRLELCPSLGSEEVTSGQLGEAGAGRRRLERWRWLASEMPRVDLFAPPGRDEPVGRDGRRVRQQPPPARPLLSKLEDKDRARWPAGVDRHDRTDQRYLISLGEAGEASATKAPRCDERQGVVTAPQDLLDHLSAAEAPDRSVMLKPRPDSDDVGRGIDHQEVVRAGLRSSPSSEGEWR